MPKAKKTEIVKVDEKELESLEGKAIDVVDVARKLRINSQKTAEVGLNLQRTLRSMKRAADAIFKKPKASAKTAWEDIKDAHRSTVAPFDEGLRLLSAKGGKWDDKQRAIALEKQRKEEERLRKEREEHQEKMRQELEKQGFDETEIPEPPEPVEVHVPMRQPKPAGQRRTVKYWAEIEDKAAVLAAALTDPVVFALIDVNGAKLNEKARIEKEAFVVPGCKLCKETKIGV